MLQCIHNSEWIPTVRIHNKVINYHAGKASQAWASEGILTILAKKGGFLSYEWEKPNFTTFSPA